MDFRGKIVVHTTSNGTKGMINATKANEIITGSFVNAKAIVKYINQNSFDEITLVSTASLAFGENNEDIMLASYIKDILEKKVIDETEIKSELQNSYVAKFLLQEAKVPGTDIDLCLDFNRFDFIIKQVEMDGRKVLIKQEV